MISSVLEKSPSLKFASDVLHCIHVFGVFEEIKNAKE